MSEEAERLFRELTNDLSLVVQFSVSKRLENKLRLGVLCRMHRSLIFPKQESQKRTDHIGIAGIVSGIEMMMEKEGSEIAEISLRQIKKLAKNAPKLEDLDESQVPRYLEYQYSAVSGKPTQTPESPSSEAIYYSIYFEAEELTRLNSDEARWDYLRKKYKDLLLPDLDTFRRTLTRIRKSAKDYLKSRTSE